MKLSREIEQRQGGVQLLFLVFAFSAFVAGGVLLPIWNLKPKDRGRFLLEDEGVQQSI